MRIGEESDHVDRNCKEDLQNGRHFETRGDLKKIRTHTSLHLYTRYVDLEFHDNR